MCKIFDWVFDSVSVKQAPQNHVEDPNQFNQNGDEDDDAIFYFFDTRGLVHLHPATPVEPPTPSPTFFEFEFVISVICECHSSLSSILSILLRIQQDYFVSVSFILKNT